jgi:CBS domain-containing protein
MVPLSEYVTVSGQATLQDAVLALRQSHEGNRDRKYLHRAVIVLDERGAVTGKIGYADILRALEPKYDQMLDGKRSLHLGFNPSFLSSMIDKLKLWEAPMERLCEKAAQLTVSSFVPAPLEAEMIAADRTLDEAIHQLVIGHHQSLLVTENQAVVGILRLTDVFEVVADEIVKCEI